MDWRPWGDEALELARSLDRPIFLSVGYSTCHWCHVMEHESFERKDVAELMNELYVCIKVDREERPDVDEVYMAATQAMVGRGGWPMSVWLTPDGDPFYAGTYFAPDDRRGMSPGGGPVVQPGFRTVLRRLSVLWHEKREDLLAQSRLLTSAVQRHFQSTLDLEPTGEGDPVGRAVRELRGSLDEVYGGFGGAPKFPPHGALRLLLHHHETVGDPAALEAALVTLRQMAAGGVHDQVGGGFHRYGTDQRWFLPHFEKMLSDNAQLGRAYTDAWRLTGDEGLREVAEGIYRWTLREMRDPHGGFWSALDADSEGEEGTFYVWTAEEIAQLLGADQGARFRQVHGVEDGGNWRDEATGEHQETNVLTRRLDEGQLAAEWGMEPAQLADEMAEAREALYAARAKRIWPHLDDKVLTSWNGLMIGSLAYAGRAHGRSDWIEAAEAAADFILRTLWKEGRLLATWRKGLGKLTAYLDDHAFFADGLLELHASTGAARWLEGARSVTDAMIAHHADPEGGFFFVAEDEEAPLVRTKSGLDRAIPSGNGVAVRVLLRLHQLTGDDRYRAHADGTLGAFEGFMARFSRAAESLLLGRALAGPGRAGAPPRDPSADDTVAAGPVRASVWVSERQLPPGGRCSLRFELNLSEGFHVQAHRPSGPMDTPTRVALSSDAPARLDEINYPEGVSWIQGGRELLVYEDGVTWTATLALSEGAAPGSMTVPLTLWTQPCDEGSCQGPVSLELSLTLEVQER